MDKNKKRLLIQYFLRCFKKKLEAEQPQEISPIFLNLFSHEELIKIVQWLFMNKVPPEVDVNTMTKEKLLQIIGDDVHILSYCIEEWAKEIQEKISPIEVNNVLTQLGLESHYLNSKTIAFWDEYDHANYNALKEKAGQYSPMFGLFTCDVSEEDKYLVITPPAKLFDSFEKAEAELNLLINERKFNKGELKIMCL